MSVSRRLLGAVFLATGLGTLAGHNQIHSTVVILLVYIGLLLLVPDEKAEL